VLVLVLKFPPQELLLGLWLLAQELPPEALVEGES
jgi:hypothetical protein